MADAGSAFLGVLKGLPGVIKRGEEKLIGAQQGLTKGLAKSVIGAATGAGEMVSKIPGVRTAVDRMYGTPGLSEQAFGKAREITAAQGPAEHIGKGIGDLAMFAASPVSKGGALAKILTPALSSAAVSGAQTGGDPLAMGLSAGLGGMTGTAQAALEGTGKMIRRGATRPAADLRTREMATKVATKGKKESQSTATKRVLRTPDWITKGTENRQEFATLAKQYDLTGGKADVARIAAAPKSVQARLSTIHDALDPSRRHWNRIWSVLASASGALGLSGNPAGYAVAGPLSVLSLAEKYPGYAAKTLDRIGQAATGVVRPVGAAGISAGTRGER
jgi:hypothetical protein